MFYAPSLQSGAREVKAEAVHLKEMEDELSFLTFFLRKCTIHDRIYKSRISKISIKTSCGIVGKQKTKHSFGANFDNVKRSNIIIGSLPNGNIIIPRISRKPKISYLTGIARNKNVVAMSIIKMKKMTILDLLILKNSFQSIFCC